MKIRQILMVFIIAVLMFMLSSAGLCSTGTTSTQYIGLNQQSGTTGGELKRHIDISSPWSAGYLYEDLVVIGRATVTDSFTMNNMSPGSDAGYWESPFDDFGFDVNPAPTQQKKPATGSSATTVTGSGEKPAAAVAGANVEVEAESESDLKKGYRWLDLF